MKIKCLQGSLSPFWETGPGRLELGKNNVVKATIVKFLWSFCMKFVPLLEFQNMSDCRSRGHKFDPSPVPYFHGD